MIELSAEGINRLLLVSDRACERALRVLYARQTASEQASHTSWVSNGKGFTGHDCGPMTAMVKGLRPLGIQRAQPNGTVKVEYFPMHLLPGQLAWLRAPAASGLCRLGKYHRQLIEEAGRVTHQRALRATRQIQARAA